MINEIMEGLKNEMAGNEVYVSEGDFQYSFARKAQELGAENVVIEYPYVLDGKRRHVDVSFVHEGLRYYVELKYKARTQIGVRRYGEEVNLANQGAQSDAMYTFYSDIDKMERIANENVETYCIFLSNDPSFRNRHNGVQNGLVSLEDGSVTNHGEIHYSNRTVLNIANSYRIEWKDFNDNLSFKYLVIQPQPRA